MSSVVISGDTSGAITLAAPAVSGTNTATLPAATGTVMVSGNMPAFSAYLSSNQSITSAVITKIQFNTETFDTNNNYDNATNYRFTPTVAGYYQISAATDFSPANATQTRAILFVYKNGSQYARLIDINGTGIYQASSSVLIYCNGSTDYIEIYGFISAVSPAFAGGSTLTWFNGSMVRSA